jgi:SAM-dependent methyltransferase
MVIIEDFHTQWKKEYKAPFSGWDFSHLKGRWSLEDPPWDYARLVKQLVKNSKALLDMDTGGGEFLASLAPLPPYTSATEGWKPNVPAARTKLEPLGVKLIETDGTDMTLPFKNEELDLIINRHGSFKPAEVFRVLKPGGTFFTQQVAGNNLQDFADTFDTGIAIPYLHETFTYWKQEFHDAGFNLSRAEEWHGRQEFLDVGAIVYYIKAIPWTAPGFDIIRNMEDLEKLQHKLDNGQRLIFTQGRFLFQAEKPKEVKNESGK